MKNIARIKKVAQLGALGMVVLAAIYKEATAAPEFIPVTNAQFSTGQYYFEGTQSGLGGNVGLTFVPAYRFTNRFSVIPTIESQYRGTRSAEELAGGNTLFQDTWEHGLAVKAVHGISQNWKLKERLGFRNKWFRETTDESWNDGLYDYRILSVGGEAERAWGKKANLGLGYDFSMLTFPNYSSLESSQGQDLAREFSGDDVLNANIHLMSLNAKTPFFGPVSNSWQVYYSPRFYTDQHVVERTGLFVSDKREDTFMGATLGFDTPFKLSDTLMLYTNFNYGYTGMDSNQNHYDARLTHFVADFYDYDQNRVGGQLTLGVKTKSGLPMYIDTGYSYSHRSYSDRPIQTVDGNYMSEKLYVIETTFTLGFSYPITKNFRARVTSMVGRSDSNNNYEAVYRYNYDNANYQFGFTYEY